MAKKTIKAGYESHDMATGMKRELLSYKKNADKIYYKVDPLEALPLPPTATKIQEPAPAPTLTVTPPPAPVPSRAPSPALMTPPTPETSLPDRPLTAADVLTVLVAVGLRKPASEIANDQTLKKLCGGNARLSLSCPYNSAAVQALTCCRSVNRSERDHRRLDQGIWHTSRPSRGHDSQRYGCLSF